ncbi:MAG: hypothetical protein AB1752_00875 [Candidatus Zixiibacteriota bacterium]
MSELDKILGSETPITPAPAFAQNVMRAVRQEAAAPPPIRFPWGRLLTGAAATAGVIVMAGATPLLGAETASGLAQSFDWLKHVILSSGVAWMAGGALLSYLSVKLSLRLTH